MTNTRSDFQLSRRNGLGRRLARLVFVGLMASVLAIGTTQAQTVTLAQSVDPESLDPTVDTLITSVSVMMNIYDSLIWRDGNGQIVPGLAESWDFPTPAQMRLKLRQGVTFHNGDAFTADDVVFSFERIFDKDNPSPLLSSLRGFVDSVEKVDDYTVLVNMPAARATIVPTLVRVPILPKAAFEAVGAQAFGMAPIGTGPFKFSKWDKNQQIVLTRYDAYWRGPAAIDTFVVRPIPEDFARFASLSNGEVDIITNLTSERLEEIKSIPGLKSEAVPSVRNLFVGIDTRKGPFTDLRARQALNHAIDKQALIDVVMGGYAIENASACTQTLFGAAPVAPYEYDVEKAKALLIEAGITGPITVDMLGPVGRYTKDKELQEAIAGMLSEVGITVNHVQPEWADFLKQWTSEIQPLHFVGTGNQVMDCDQHLGYRIDGARYDRFYQSDAVDALIQSELQDYDETSRKATLAEIQQLVRDDAPWIFLFDLMDLFGMSERIDWQPRADEMVWAYDIKVAQ